MIWMNQYEIDEAVAVFASDPVLGPATRFLRDFAQEVNSHSDGWPYWSPPGKAAGKLMQLIYANLRSGMGAYPVASKPSKADVLKTLAPIKAFMTRRGTAAGMTLPSLNF
jgi:hypothetical protein